MDPTIAASGVVSFIDATEIKFVVCSGATNVRRNNGESFLWGDRNLWSGW